jgi:CO/xanthine dehydrogenase FAD-binding subunit
MIISDIIMPSSLADAVSSMDSDGTAIVCSGGTGIFGIQGGRYLSIPEKTVCVYHLPELRTINLTERHVEIGAALPLSEVIELGERALTAPFLQALNLVAGPSVRSLATIAGNLCARDRFMGLWAPMAALEAIAEFRKPGSSRWINVNRLRDDEGNPLERPKELMTRVRIPLATWDIWEVRRFGPPGYPSDSFASFAFLARVEKQSIVEARACLSGRKAYRARDFESALSGKRLPVTDRDRDILVQSFSEGAETAGFPPSTLAKARILVDAILERMSTR